MAKLILKPAIDRSKVRVTIDQKLLSDLNDIASKTANLSLDEVVEQCLAFAIRQIKQNA